MLPGRRRSGDHKENLTSAADFRTRNALLGKIGVLISINIFGKELVYRFSYSSSDI